MVMYPCSFVLVVKKILNFLPWPMGVGSVVANPVMYIHTIMCDNLHKMYKPCNYYWNSCPPFQVSNTLNLTIKLYYVHTCCMHAIKI